mgnify:CR=1 FL=1
MHIVDYFVIAGYFALVMYLGYYSMKKVSNFDDYAVAGRSMPLPIFFAAIAATLCGGGATIGRISFMHTTGIIVFFALTGVVINQIFSGLFISGRVHNAGKNVYSLGDLYGIYYGRSGRLLSSVFGFLFCVGAFGVQILAMGAILQTATGISLIPAALIASIVTLAYTWSGGILAVTLTDAVQYVIIVIGVTLCAYLAIDHLGGFDAMMSILYSNPRFETNMKPLANWSLVQFLGLFFSFLLGEFCAPYYIQRYASTKSAKDSKNGLLIFGVHWIFFMATTAAIGLASMAIQPDVKPDLAFTNLIRDILPPGAPAKRGGDGSPPLFAGAPGAAPVFVPACGSGTGLLSRLQPSQQHGADSAPVFGQIIVSDEPPRIMVEHAVRFVLLQSPDQRGFPVFEDKGGERPHALLVEHGVVAGECRALPAAVELFLFAAVEGLAA